MPLNPPKCPGCSGTKPGHMYLCRGCWFTLPRSARGPLLRRDAQASARLVELYRQIQEGVPLHKIEISVR